MHRERRHAFAQDDMEVEMVADDGRVRLRFFGGASLELAVPAHLVPYYRRLVRGDRPPEP